MWKLWSSGFWGSETVMYLCFNLTSDHSCPEPDIATRILKKNSEASDLSVRSGDQLDRWFAIVILCTSYVQSHYTYTYISRAVSNFHFQNAPIPHEGIFRLPPFCLDIQILEIKPCGCGPGSRIRDMEADLIYWWTYLEYFLFLLASRTGTVGWTEHCAKVCGHCKVFGLYQPPWRSKTSMPMLSPKAFAINS